MTVQEEWKEQDLADYQAVIDRVLQCLTTKKSPDSSGASAVVSVSQEQKRIDDIDGYFTKLRNKKIASEEEKDLAASLESIYEKLEVFAREILDEIELNRESKKKIDAKQSQEQTSESTGKACLLMGLPGAGKSSSLTAALDHGFLSQAILFDDDDFKRAILEEAEKNPSKKVKVENEIFASVQEIIRKANPSYTREDLTENWEQWFVRLIHPAVQRVASNKRQECMLHNKSFILHRVFAYWPDFKSTIEEIVSAGYSKITVVYVHTESDEAIERGKKRAQDTPGREVLVGYVTRLAETLELYGKEKDVDLTKLQEHSVHPIFNYFRGRSLKPNESIDFLFFYNGKSIPMNQPPLYIPDLSRRKQELDHRKELEKANDDVDNFKSKADACQFRPRFHLAPRAGSMSDPYGIIWYKDKWHLFFQHAPYFCQEEFNKDPNLKYWGHVVSVDLVHWQHAPIALAPNEPFDCDGCFSGCAVDDNGLLTLMYTGNVWEDREKDHVDEVICKAISYDGKKFYKAPGNPIIGQRPKDILGNDFSGHFRDPFIFEREQGDGSHCRYMLLAARVKKENNNGSILLYKQCAERRERWEYKGVLLSSNDVGLDLGAYMLECPSILTLGDAAVLICSPQFNGSRTHNNHNFQNINTCVAITGYLDLEGCKFSKPTCFELDRGFDCYAATGFVDNQKRALLLCWMGMRDEKDFGEGWTGMLTTIREIALAADGTVITYPFRDLEMLREPGVEFSKENVFIKENEEISFDELSGRSIEIKVEFKFDISNKATAFGVKICCPEGSDIKSNEATIIKVKPGESMAYLDRSNTCNARTPSEQRVRKGRLVLSKKDTVRLHIFVDYSSVEVFFDDGRLAMSSRIYPERNCTGVRLFSVEGSVEVLSLLKWNLSFLESVA